MDWIPPEEGSGEDFSLEAQKQQEMQNEHLWREVQGEEESELVVNAVQ